MSSRPDFPLGGEDPQHYGLESALNYVWDVATLSWIKSTGSGGGGGGAVTIADGADVAEGTTTDVAWTSGAGTVVALLKTIAGGGGGGSGPVTIIDGGDVAEGSTADAAWVSGAGTVISLLKKIASAGGGAVSIADGSDVAEGATTDAATVTDAAGTVSGKLRGLVKWAFERMPASLGQKAMAASFPVVIASDQSAVPISGTVTTGGLTDAQLRASAVPVSGTFFQATQPVSAAALPLPAGASTAALQTQPGVDIGDVTINNAAGAAAVNVQDGGNSITVDGVFFQATQPVSAASLPLPTGAATAALQLPDGHNVTVDNASGGAAVNIQDGGNVITVDGTVAVTGALTDAQLRATPVPVSGTVAATQSGTWTVQPGNTPNTTAWLVSTKTDLAPSAPAAATVGVASAQAVAANASRKGLALVNVSNARISFGLGATAVLDNGITLYPGGVWEMDEHTFDLGAVNAIASAAASPLAVQEFA